MPGVGGQELVFKGHGVNTVLWHSVDTGAAGAGHGGGLQHIRSIQSSHSHVPIDRKKENLTHTLSYTHSSVHRVEVES